MGAGDARPFPSGSVAQFIIHGNMFDVVPAADGADAKSARLLPLKGFLEEVMFEGYDVVLHYDRGKGIRATSGAEDWGDWLEQSRRGQRFDGQLREPGKALELIDRYLLRTLNLQAIAAREGKANPRIAVVIDFAEFVVPAGEAIQLGGEFSANVVKVLGWANDPAILQSNIATVLLTEGLHDLNEPGRREPPRRQAPHPAARRGRDARVRPDAPRAAVPGSASQLRGADGDARPPPDRPVAASAPDGREPGAEERAEASPPPT